MIKNKVAIGFVIFNSERNLIDRLQVALDADFDIFIYDNSPKNGDVRFFCNDHDRISYSTGGVNMGLGLGIATVCSQAYYSNFDALVFFDQDSIFNIETLKVIINFYLLRTDLCSTHSAVVFNQNNINSEVNFKDVMLAINSGSLFYLHNLEKIGWHSSEYFVDCVDYEFCLRSSNSNLKIGEYSCTPGFDHTAEQADKIYKVFGKSYSMRAYPFFRMSDTFKSSLKLILKSAISGNFKFSKKIFILLLIYIFTQIFVRIFNLIYKPKVSK